MKRPLVWLTLILCLGISLGNHIRAPLFLLQVLTVIFLVLCFLSLKKGLRFNILLCCLVFLLGAILLKNTQILPKCHISKFISFNRYKFYTIKGIIYSQPVLKNNRTSFIFKTEELQFDNLNYKCCGNILVYIKGRKNLDYAEELLLSGNLYRPFGRGGYGRRSYKEYLYNQGIYYIMNVKVANLAVKLNKNKGLAVKRFALWLKGKMENIIFKYVSYVPANILDAMVLGERRNITPFINNVMVKSGTMHILVVSGFNTVLVTFIVISILKLIRLSRKARIFVTIPLSLLYCLLTGASNPVVRATIMTIVFLFAYLVRREPDIYHSCAMAAMIILGINPRQLFDPGFQLSFISVLSIVYLYPRLKLILRLSSVKIKFIRFFLEGCLVSLSAWLGTAGFIAYYFKIFSPVTVIANIFTVPLATLITLCGFSLIIMGSLCPPIAPFLASSTELAVTLLININALLIKIPGAYFYLPIR